jgi:peroxisomal 3,2-trans-enoyl-CoA isomerase
MPIPPKLANLSISLKNGVALLKYNRSKPGNALNTPLIKVSIRSGNKPLLLTSTQDILTGFKWADSEDHVKVILQTGEGKIFTAGLDLQDQSVVGPDTVISDEFLNTIGYANQIPC